MRWGFGIGEKRNVRKAEPLRVKTGLRREVILSILTPAALKSLQGYHFILRRAIKGKNRLLLITPKSELFLDTLSGISPMS